MSGQLQTSLRRQRGMGYWGWLMVVAAFGFVFTCVAKMAPAYLDASYVDQALRALAENPRVRNMTRGEIEQEMSRFFTLNNVRGEPTKAVRVIPGTDGMLVSVAYELRQPLIYNVDVIMKFNKQLNIAKTDLCCEPLVDLEQLRKRD
ncbi:hypothetical protein Maes01_00424 [Microbulbifer aestuariivivens]|uniref:DUF4845 domain-containing protein n=1 Tax=Microbulbifer aestuariivivens TaxID=1908308 RepID=A0ABP9WL84_9GAMM